MRFIVKRKEVWTQTIVVEAADEKEAKAKAEHDDGVIDEDPRFQKFLRSEAWEVIAEEEKPKE